MAEDAVVESLRPVKLESEQINSIRAVFETLDDSRSGQVAKSRLQVLCASLCRDCDVPFSSENLVEYKGGQTSLTCRDFLDYLQEDLLPKGESSFVSDRSMLKILQFGRNLIISSLCDSVFTVLNFACMCHSGRLELCLYQHFVRHKRLPLECYKSIVHLFELEVQNIGISFRKFFKNPRM